MDVIASWRAMGYLDYLTEAGYIPTLLTLRWEKHTTGVWKRHSKLSLRHIEPQDTGGEIIRLPLAESIGGKVWRLLSKVSVFRKIILFLAYQKGHLDANAEQWDVYVSFRNFLRRHLKTHHYDCVIGIFSPHHHLKLAYMLYKRYRIPYVLDFRDLWSTRIVEKEYVPNKLERIQDRACAKFWKKWSKYALFASITSQAWLKKLEEIVECHGKVIRNGFEEAHFPDYRSYRSKKFIVLHCGSLYYHQDLRAFVEGVRLFLLEHLQVRDFKSPNLEATDLSNLEFEIHFIGAYKATYPKSSTSYMPPEAIDTLLAPISGVVKMLPRCSRSKAAQYMQKAEVLLMPSFRKHKGTYSAKIFDYLAARRPILLTPDDHSLLSALVQKEQAGYIASVPEEVSQFLTKAYVFMAQRGTLYVYERGALS